MREEQTHMLREEMERVSKQLFLDVADKNLGDRVLRQPSIDTLDLLDEELLGD